MSESRDHGSPLLSICIPTYSRARLLRNCLRSALASAAGHEDLVEICVSDNGSADGTAQVVEEASRAGRLKSRRSERNLGIPRNFLHVVAMAKGEFVWLVGDDDLVLPHAVAAAVALITHNPSADFFFVNAFELPASHLDAFPHPFDTANLPARMRRFAPVTSDGPRPFLDLIDPDVSFDFMGAMFLSIFRRRRWAEHAHVLDAAAVADPRVFSHFDNTFPHVRIFAAAFPGTQACVLCEPLSVSVSGSREWAPMYPLVRSVRLVEALERYRAGGLPLWRYLRYRNRTLQYLLPDLVWMFFHRPVSGLHYLNPVVWVAKNSWFPNTYLSPLYYAVRKAKNLFAGAREAT